MNADKGIQYEYANGIAVITMDDGKRNALPPAMFRGLYAALRQAEKDKAIVILTGREGVFSAGYDLKVMKAGNADTLRMLRAGYSLTARMLNFPYPIISACSGHCYAMGVFMMLSADYVIGSKGPFQVSANEVALGLPMPRVACSVMRQRLTPAGYQRAAILAEQFSPESALSVGFFDELVDPSELLGRARDVAKGFAELDMRAHAETKRRVRSSVIPAIRRQVPLDLVEAVKIGLRGTKPKSRQ